MPRQSSKNVELQGVKIYQHKTGTIAITKKNGWIGQISNNPTSKNYNQMVFNNLKEILIEAGKWEENELKLGQGRRETKAQDIMDLDGEPYGYIYVTTNRITGKRYVGKHKNNGSEYLGSGTDFKIAVEEYGKENFEHRQIAFAFSAEQLNILEKTYIDSFLAVSDNNFYNLAPGGDVWYKKKDGGEAC